jgi:hypothetical protein
MVRALLLAGSGLMIIVEHQLCNFLSQGWRDSSWKFAVRQPVKGIVFAASAAKKRSATTSRRAASRQK